MKRSAPLKKSFDDSDCPDSGLQIAGLFSILLKNSIIINNEIAIDEF